MFGHEATYTIIANYKLIRTIFVTGSVKLLYVSMQILTHYNLITLACIIVRAQNLVYISWQIIQLATF